MSTLIREHVALGNLTTLKVGGDARYYAEVHTIEDIKEAGLFAAQTALPLFVLGGGSNILVADSGYDGVVMHMKLRGVTYVTNGDGSVLVTAAAGEVFDELVASTVDRGLWGLENLSHIPGSVGATPIQNVGAYGVEVSSLIYAVVTYHVPSQTIRTFTADECQFGYRDSFFKTSIGREYVVTAVQFLLRTTPTPRLLYKDLSDYFGNQIPQLQEVREAVIVIRSKKFPDWKTTGTAGSFFKNPIVTRMRAAELRERFPNLPLYEAPHNQMKCSLGFILDQVCGLKGFRLGKVRLYEQQALVVVVDEGATEKSVSEFAKIISTRVFDATGIIIEREVITIEK